MSDHWSWISAYLDQELTDAEQQQLELWVSADRAHQELFAFQCVVIHAQLQELFNEGRLQEELLKHAGQLVERTASHAGAQTWTADELSFLLQDEGLAGNRRTDSRRQKFYQRIPVLAAGVLAACFLTVFLSWRIWTQPEAVAYVSRCFACRWANSQEPITGGAVLEKHRDLELLEGQVQIVFRSGALLTVEGPAKLRVDDPLFCELYSGNVSAFVPAEAKGFALQSGPVKVVDRGTEFTLRALEPDSVELSVHRGYVDVELQQPLFQGPDQLQVVEKRAYHFDTRLGEVRSLPFDDTVWISSPNNR